MTDLVRALERIIADLGESAEPWALVGGLAVSVRTEPRTTRDVDIAVAVADDSAAETLVRRLLGRGYGLVGGVEQTEAGRLATMRLEPPSSGPVGAVVDLLFATTGIEAEVCEHADRFEVLEGLEAPVAAIGHLIAMKLLSRDDDRRPQDAVDLRALLAVATPIDLQTARDAVDMIVSRGFSRGRDLVARLADAVIRLGG